VKPTRKISRRSFMTTVVGGAVVGAAALTIATEAATAQTGVTNRDPGDRPGNGRTGITNRDPGDRPGYGRRAGGGGGCATGVTNSDPGDRPGNGRNGVTNRDPSDRPGYGCRR
jgi:hypothetical protein